MTESLVKQRIALVGGAGFIGHNLALKLSELGAEVLVVDSLAVNNYYHFKNQIDIIPHAALYLNIIQQRLDLFGQHNIRLIEVDFREYVKVSRIIYDFHPDIIIHLAAVANANVSNKDPYSTFDHSLRTLENALDIARDKEINVKRFVYFSSSMVYGDFADGYVTEQSPCEPIGIYGALKFAGEKMVIAYNQVFDLPYTIVRPSALYGPRCVSRRVGQVFIENALQGLDVTVEGDGSDRLDFTYVKDLVQGIILAITREEARNQIFNLTYGESRSILEMAEILQEHFPCIRIKNRERNKLMPHRGTLSVEKARRLLGHEPQCPLDVGFVEYIEWYKSVWEQVR